MEPPRGGRIVSCAHSKCPTTFCPECGKKITAREGLLAFLNGKVAVLEKNLARFEKRLAESKAGDDFHEKRQRNVRRAMEVLSKWSNWRRELEALIKKAGG